MVHKVRRWLENCPHIYALTVDTLGAGPATGLFCREVTALRQDILGNRKPRFKYLLRHRGQTHENWAEAFGLWVLENPPEEFRVSLRGGRQCSPTRDGFSTWEVELTVGKEL